MGFHQITDRGHRRRRSDRIEVIRRQGSSEAGRLARRVVQFLFNVEGLAEVENADHKHYQQRQGHRELEQLGARGIGQKKDFPPAKLRFRRPH